ncbi:MAG TPA: YbaN family protein [Burkholderiales bacterium]|nr:YbaN family protein [Burkholderiales bacterium]
MAKQDYSAEVMEHRSPLVRMLLLCAGVVFVVLGFIGLLLPVMPTTVFLVLAAACFARGSKRFYNLLLNSPAFGPAILEWRRHRSIPRRTKLFAIAATVVSFAVSIVLFLHDPWLRAGMAIFGLGLVFALCRIPSRDGPGRKS